MAAALEPQQRAALMTRLGQLHDAIFDNAAVDGMFLEWCEAKTQYALQILQVSFNAFTHVKSKTCRY